MSEPNPERMLLPDDRPPDNVLDEMARYHFEAEYDLENWDEIHPTVKDDYVEHMKDALQCPAFIGWLREMRNAELEKVCTFIATHDYCAEGDCIRPARGNLKYINSHWINAIRSLKEQS